MIRFRTACLLLFAAVVLVFPKLTSAWQFELNASFIGAASAARPPLSAVADSPEEILTAQRGPERRGGRSFITRCSSDDERYTRCHLEGVVWNVQVDRQWSGSPCIHGRTWGFDNDEIWVDRGCRADFRVWAGGGYQGRPAVVACASGDERLNRCHVGEGIWNVQMRKQYSGSPCVLGDTWGFDDDEIWVDHGCRADFYVWAGGGFARRSQIVNCKSDDERLNRCHIGGDVVNVRLEVQNSGSPCIQGRTWGFDDDEIWVDRGCRANFRVWTRR